PAGTYTKSFEVANSARIKENRERWKSGGGFFACVVEDVRRFSRSTILAGCTVLHTRSSACGWRGELRDAVKVSLEADPPQVHATRSCRSKQSRRPKPLPSLQNARGERRQCGRA